MKTFIIMALLLTGFVWFVANNQGALKPHNTSSAVATKSNRVTPLVARPSDTDICVMAHVFIKRQLKSPTSAEFPACSTADTTISGSGSNWTVKSYVDAQNSFGANLRADYTVAMRYQADTDKWTMASFTLDNR